MPMRGATSRHIETLLPIGPAGTITLSGTVTESQTHGSIVFTDSPMGTVTLSGTQTGSVSASDSPTGTITLGAVTPTSGPWWISRFSPDIDQYLAHTLFITGSITLNGSVVESNVFTGPVVRLTVAVSDSSLTNVAVSDSAVTNLVLSDAAV